MSKFRKDAKIPETYAQAQIFEVTGLYHENTQLGQHMQTVDVALQTSTIKVCSLSAHMSTQFWYLHQRLRMSMGVW